MQVGLRTYQHPGTCSLIWYVFNAFMQAVQQAEGCARYVTNDTLLLILRQLAFITFGPSHQNIGLKIVALYWNILYKETQENCSTLIAVRNYFMFEFPCILSLYYIRNQQDATLAVSFISHCKITLHVSDAFCVHHQEY